LWFYIAVVPAVTVLATWIVLNDMLLNEQRLLGSADHATVHHQYTVLCQYVSAQLAKLAPRTPAAMDRSSSCCTAPVLQVALVEQLLDEVWAGPWALAVNPGWHANTPAAYQGLVNSFEAAYSFMPIATQVGADAASQPFSAVCNSCRVWLRVAYALTGLMQFHTWYE
jgi:hypothetical protein